MSFRNHGGAGQQRQIAVLPEVSDVTAMVVRGVGTFARKHKVISGSYLLGIVVLLFVGSGIPLTVQQQREYNRIMNTIDLQAEYDASQEYWYAYNNYRATKGWFTCDGLCQRNKDRMMKAERHLNAIRQEGQARMSDAKSVAGIFSEIGVGEVKDSFWTYFQSGKQFAKRQSMWDIMFMSIRSMSRGRDESWIEYGIKILINLLLNLSMGLIMALVFFIFGLWNIVRSYQANPIVAVIFFVASACAAFAFVASYLLAVYSAAGGAVYGVLKLAETSARARIADQRRNEGIYNRPHYD